LVGLVRHSLNRQSNLEKVNVSSSRAAVIKFETDIKLSKSYEIKDFDQNAYFDLNCNTLFRQVTFNLNLY